MRQPEREIKREKETERNRDRQTYRQTERSTYLKGQYGLIPVGKVGVHGHNDTVGNDGEYDEVLERRPAHEPDEHSPEQNRVS